MNGTSFEVRCEILSELWFKYKNETTFSDFISYNDLGLPLAFFLSEGIVSSTPKAMAMVNESFDLFLAALDIKEDAGYDSLDDLLMIN
jgi:hypothetical protein